MEITSFIEAFLKDCFEESQNLYDIKNETLIVIFDWIRGIQIAKQIRYATTHNLYQSTSTFTVEKRKTC